MDAHFTDISTRLFSPRLWRGFGAPSNMNPSGSSYQSPSGNSVLGFFDDFHTFQASTLEGPYLILEDATCAVEQTADTATEKGLLLFDGVGDTENDQMVIQWGRGLGAPFKLADHDLAFECRLTVTAITAAKWSLGVGLGEVGMGADQGLFLDANQNLADKNFLGFVSLLAEGAAWDGAFKADGQTYQDGATKTKLNALHTMVANTYVKLGFRYRAHPKTVEWYVNGGALNSVTPARLTATEVDAATFPDEVFMAPIIGAKDGAGNSAMDMKLDWWACAQYE